MGAAKTLPSQLAVLEPLPPCAFSPPARILTPRPSSPPPASARASGTLVDAGTDLRRPSNAPCSLSRSGWRLGSAPSSPPPSWLPGLRSSLGHRLRHPVQEPLDVPAPEPSERDNRLPPLTRRLGPAERAALTASSDTVEDQGVCSATRSHCAAVARRAISSFRSPAIVWRSRPHLATEWRGDQADLVPRSTSMSAFWPCSAQPCSLLSRPPG